MSYITNFVEAGIEENGNSGILRTKKIDNMQPIPAIPSFNISNLYYVEDMPLLLNLNITTHLMK